MSCFIATNVTTLGKFYCFADREIGLGANCPANNRFTLLRHF